MRGREAIASGRAVLFWRALALDCIAIIGAGGIILT